MVEIIVAANLVAIKVVIDTVTLVIIVAMDAVVTEALETVEATVDMDNYTIILLWRMLVNYN